MMTLAAAHTPGKFYVVCNTCLWTPGRALPEHDAYNQADSHDQDCPGAIPTTTTKAQIAKAQKIINGDY